MSIQSRVVDTVESWCGKRPEELSTVLKDLWDDTAPGSSHSSLEFDPDGIDDLIQKLHSEFGASPRRRVTATAFDFRSGGKIQTVQKLVDEAVTFPLVESMDFAESAVPPLALAEPSPARPMRKPVAKKAGAAKNTPARKTLKSAPNPRRAKVVKKAKAKRPAARKRRP